MSVYIFLPCFPPDNLFRVQVLPSLLCSSILIHLTESMISKVPVQLTISYLCSPNCHLPPSSTFLHVSNLHHPEWHPLSHLNPAQAHLSPVPSIALLASFHSKLKLRLKVSGHFGQFSVHCTWKLNFIQNSKIIVKARTLPPPVRLGPWVWSTHYTGVVQ